MADIREYISQTSFSVMKRNDFCEELESLLGDCMGPGSMNDSIRQYMSTYGFDHYGDFDPDRMEDSTTKPGSVLRLLSETLKDIPLPEDGPVIDLGCSVGRTSFELSKAFNTGVIGIDLNFAMLQAAAKVLETGCFTYPKRRVGMAYDLKKVETGFKEDKNLDFWVCDVLNLPFSDAMFSFGLSLNLLDCVGEPYLHLKEIERVLKPGAHAVISTPYDWNPNATPVEQWLGGHSQRSDLKGRSEDILCSFFKGGSHSNSIETLKMVFEKQHLPWTIRIHDRSFMNYSVHVMGLKKIVA